MMSPDTPGGWPFEERIMYQLLTTPLVGFVLLARITSATRPVDGRGNEIARRIRDIAQIARISTVLRRESKIVGWKRSINHSIILAGKARHRLGRRA